MLIKHINFSLILLASLGSSVQARDLSWQCESGSWDNAECWAPNNIPNADDNILISSGANISSNSVYVSHPGAISHTGGYNSIAHNLINTGRYALSGNAELLAEQEIIGYLESGIFTQHGGTNRVTNQLDVGLYTSNSTPGYYTLNDGNLIVSQENIGIVGFGEFTQNGGVHDVEHFLTLGSYYGNNGIYIQNSGLLKADFENIGDAGTGRFEQNGGVNTVGVLGIAQSGGGSGSYLLNGPGQLLANNEYIGNTGVSGTFIQNGGLNTVNERLVVGFHTSGSYTLNDGLVSASNEYIGIFGDGVFTQLGGTHIVSNQLILGLNVGSSGTYNLQGGLLDVSTINAANEGNANFNFTGGRLAVDTFIGNLVNNGGVLGPGNSPGITTVQGDFSQSIDGTYAVEIGGLQAGSEYDVLNVSGRASLGGRLRLSLFGLENGYVLQAGHSFDILTAVAISGAFDDVTFDDLSSNLRWNIAYLADFDGDLDVVRLNIAAVPLPQSWLMLLSGLGVFVALKRRSAGVA
ncbi:VPLPA-CTERM sorting domain-containing protein [Methylomonas sp. ZR1]|uniref:VPLPA-CTERM sorting domain-containing protein n=1 Tax=Methylomonas sp. ZR1 TaxID=1797072 RepID=UPI0014912792|nr:VPLPA-CTERM sorting domain-containing protein [Methylomonas sp. ZR1]NOV31781.1 hypothetical protein [Methylomonas sp. ZR1]